MKSKALCDAAAVINNVFKHDENQIVLSVCL